MKTISSESRTGKPRSRDELLRHPPAPSCSDHRWPQMLRYMDLSRTKLGFRFLRNSFFYRAACSCGRLGNRRPLRIADSWSLSPQRSITASPPPPTTVEKLRVQFACPGRRRHHDSQTHPRMCKTGICMSRQVAKKCFRRLDFGFQVLVGHQDKPRTSLSGLSRIFVVVVSTMFCNAFRPARPFTREPISHLQHRLSRRQDAACAAPDPLTLPTCASRSGSHCGASPSTAAPPVSVLRCFDTVAGPNCGCLPRMLIRGLGLES